jgi:hypothetical protein
MTDTTKAVDALDGIEPSAWQCKYNQDPVWSYCSKEFAAWMLREPSEFAGYEVRAIYDRAAIQSALERARADERAKILAMIPGGSSVDPQWVCDMIREMGTTGEQG